MNEAIKNEVIQQLDKLPTLFKYDMALIMLLAIYEKLPEWKEQQRQGHALILENLEGFIGSIKKGDE